MSPALLTLLTFAAGVLLVLAVASLATDLYFRDRRRISQRVDEEFRRHQRETIRTSPLFKNLGQAAAEVGEERSLNLRERFVAIVEQSALRINPRRLVGLMAITGFAVGGLAGAIRGNALLGVVVGVVATAVPFLYVLRKRNARLEKMLLQLPDAFDLMARMIRAGHTIAQAQHIVATEFEQPLAGEFAYCYEQQDLGLSPEVALRDLARRTGLLEIKIFVLALLVHQHSGGNLAELLDKLSQMIRERFRVRLKIRAITGEGRLQAIVLLGLPIALLLLLMAISRTHASNLAANPNLILGMLVAEGIGALWIRKIVDIDI